MPQDEPEVKLPDEKESHAGPKVAFVWSPLSLSINNTPLPVYTPSFSPI
jgi:hypothetical protein